MSFLEVLVIIILLPFAIGAAVWILSLAGVVISIPFLWIADRYERWSRKRRISNDEKEAEKYGIAVWQYRLYRKREHDVGDPIQDQIDRRKA